MADPDLAFINSKDQLIQDYTQVFLELEKIFDSARCEKCGHVAGSPVVALNSERVDKLDENRRGFVQLCDLEESLKNNEYAQMVKKNFPVILRVGNALLPFLENGSPALLTIAKDIGYIGIGIAFFAELVVLKQIIEKDATRDGASAKVRIQKNEQRLDDIEALIEKAELEDFDGCSKKKSRLLKSLEVKIRFCKMDISECILMTAKLYEKMKSTIGAFNKKLIKSAVAAGFLGTVSVAGAVAAIVATGGLAIVAGVAAGLTGVATGGFSYHAKLCGDFKCDFIIMKEKCEILLEKVIRLENRLKLNVMALNENNIDVGISLEDFDEALLIE